MRGVIQIGVLACQGAFVEHVQKFKELNAAEPVDGFELQVREVRNMSDVSPALSGLIIPGGESTTMAHFLGQHGLLEAIRDWQTACEGAAPIWGICAGLILLSDTVTEATPVAECRLGGLDVVTSRNFYGRQNDSFETTIQLSEFWQDKCLGGPPSEQNNRHNGIFIRAPKILKICSPAVDVLAEISHGDDGRSVVAAQQGNIMATSFHPELTASMLWHQHFLRKLLNYVNSPIGARLRE